MGHYTVKPVKAGLTLDEIVALDETSIRFAVEKTECDEAAVFQGDAYRYSLRLDPSGAWIIFKRETPIVTLAGRTQ